MRRFVAIIMMLIALESMTQGREVRSNITYGAEWSYVATIYTSYHYNFFSPEGYRYNQSGRSLGWSNNGEALIHVGYNLNDAWNLSVYTGISGYTDVHNAIPLSLRRTRIWSKSHTEDSWLTFIDAGTGISLKEEPQETFSGKVGAGYRLALSRVSKLDFLVAARCTYTHPQIYFSNEPITLRWTNRNDCILISFSLGMALTF